MFVDNFNSSRLLVDMLRLNFTLGTKFGIFLCTCSGE